MQAGVEGIVGISEPTRQAVYMAWVHGAKKHRLIEDPHEPVGPRKARIDDWRAFSNPKHPVCVAMTASGHFAAALHYAVHIHSRS